MIGKIALILAVTAIALVLLWRHVGIQSSNEPGGILGTPDQRLAEGIRACTRLHGNEQVRSKRLSDCSIGCTRPLTDEGRECLSNCRKEAEAFGSCLMQYTLP